MVAAFPRPIIAIVGRPNVGKSTLFNRLLGLRKAVVSPVGGTTRDWLCGQMTWRGTPVTLVDTGGFDFAPSTGLGQAVQRHLQQALAQADGFVFVCDAQVGCLPADAMILDRLRTTGKPVVLAVNKADRQLTVPSDFFSLGVAHPVAVSALHGRGVGELLDRLIEQDHHPPSDHVTSPATGGPQHRPLLTVAIVGRQNVGKSSLLNALLRQERVIVSDIPGTTRDAIDTTLIVDGQPIVLIDTAGLRHRRKVKTPLELFAMSRSFEAIERSEVALVVLDATQGITGDDQRIVRRVIEAGRGLVLLANKWDLVKGVSERHLAEGFRRALPHAAYAPVLAVSAMTGFQVMTSVALAQRLFASMQRGLPDARCVALVRGALASHPPIRIRGRPVRLHHARWRPGRPPRLELVTTPPLRELPPAMVRSLLNRLHADPRLSGVPVQLVLVPRAVR